MSRRFRALKACYIFTFEGQDRPQHYSAGEEVNFDLEFPRDENGKEIVHPFLQELSGGEAEASGPPKGGTALSESSRRLTVQRAVSKLDSEEGDHWTQEGRPAVHAVNTLAGDPAEVISRAEITTFCPTVLRS